MRYLSLALSMLAVAACASVPPGTASPTERTGNMTFTTSTSASVVNTAIARPIDEVWRALPAAYASLGIPLTTLDPKVHMGGNEGLKTRRVLGNVAMSHYIECGTTQIGPNADSYDVVLSVVTQLTSGGTGATKITTTLEGSAKPISYAQEYSRCSSKGVLEARISDSLTAFVMRR